MPRNPALDRLAALATDWERLPQLLGEAIEDSGVSRAELARRLKLPPPRISEWLSGTRRPSARQTKAIVRALRRGA